jgi:hypothetical protein
LCAEDAGLQFLNISLPIPSLFKYYRDCLAEGEAHLPDVVEWWVAGMSDGLGHHKGQQARHMM